MGEVWSALHLITNKRVALKVLKGESDSEARAETVRRFFREARAMSAVNHPNVVAVHDLFTHEGSPVMVMDLLEGEPLSSKLGREGWLELHELATILVPIISAVGMAHERGIVHRDLKPENIFLALSPSRVIEPKVLDFGIAKLSTGAIDAGQTEALTNTGTLLGTPHYMAPEQIFGEKSLDARCDVWAMGVILYQCLSGQRPFDGDNVGQIFKSIVTSRPAPLAEVQPGVPAALSELVERMLERDVDARCPDLREAFEVVGRFADVSVSSFGPPVTSEVSSVVSAAPPSRPSWTEAEVPTVLEAGQTPLMASEEPRRRGRKLVFLFVGAGLAGLATAGLMAWSREPPPQPVATGFESSEKAAANTEPSSHAPSVSVAVASAPMMMPSEAVSEPSRPAPAASTSVASRLPRPRSSSLPTKPAESAAAPAAPAKLPGGILDQERAPF